MNLSRSQSKLIHHFSKGITLLELIITIAISSIVLAGSALFLSTSIKLMTETSMLKTPNNNSRVALNILTQDLLSNQGNFNLISTNNSNKLTFMIKDQHDNTIKTINYICNYITKKFSRQLDLASPEILIDQVQHCEFFMDISSNLLNVTLFTKMIIMEDNAANTLYEVINAPYPG